MLASTAIDFPLIEEKARRLQIDLWDHQCNLWEGESVTPIDVCDPWKAAKHLGYEVQEGWVDRPGTRSGFQLGGFLNRPMKLIGLSDQFAQRTMRFTLAHEVGHVLLHPGLHHHRELPLQGITEPHEPVHPREREANHFAGCFLVPAKQLRRAFRATFQTDRLTLTDNVAFELLGAGFMSLMNTPYESLAFERVVAQALRFGGRQFGPLHKLFQVSPTTLAIRLRQVGLTRR
jgi:hypothetical protein